MQNEIRVKNHKLGQKNKPFRMGPIIAPDGRREIQISANSKHSDISFHFQSQLNYGAILVYFEHTRCSRI